MIVEDFDLREFFAEFVHEFFWFGLREDEEELVFCWTCQMGYERLV